MVNLPETLLMGANQTVLWGFVWPKLQLYDVYKYLAAFCKRRAKEEQKKSKRILQIGVHYGDLHDLRNEPIFNLREIMPMLLDKSCQ